MRSSSYSTVAVWRRNHREEPSRNMSAPGSVFGLPTHGSRLSPLSSRLQYSSMHFGPFPARNSFPQKCVMEFQSAVSPLNERRSPIHFRTAFATGESPTGQSATALQSARIPPHASVASAARRSCVNGADSSAESDAVSEKNGKKHHNPYAESEELEGQMSFYGNGDKD